MTKDIIKQMESKYGKKVAYGIRVLKMLGLKSIDEKSLRENSLNIKDSISQFVEKVFGKGDAKKIKERMAAGKESGEFENIEDFMLYWFGLLKTINMILGKEGTVAFKQSLEMKKGLYLNEEFVLWFPGESICELPRGRIAEFNQREWKKSTVILTNMNLRTHIGEERHKIILGEIYSVNRDIGFKRNSNPVIAIDYYGYGEKKSTNLYSGSEKDISAFKSKINSALRLNYKESAFTGIERKILVGIFSGLTDLKAMSVMLGITEEETKSKIVELKKIGALDNSGNLTKKGRIQIASNFASRVSLTENQNKILVGISSEVIDSKTLSVMLGINDDKIKLSRSGLSKLGLLDKSGKLTEIGKMYVEKIGKV